MVLSRWPAAFFLALLAAKSAQADLARGLSGTDGHDHDHGGGATSSNVVMPTVSVALSEDTVTITLAGPNENWFGVAFGGTVMSDQPYAIIVNGAHDVEEITLSAHAVTNRHGGSGLTVVSSESVGSTYTTVIQRPLTGGHAGTVFTGSSEIPIMLAAGTMETLAYHGSGRYSVSTVQALPTPSPPNDGHSHSHASPPAATSSTNVSGGMQRHFATAIAIGLALANGLQKL